MGFVVLDRKRHFLVTILHFLVTTAALTNTTHTHTHLNLVVQFGTVHFRLRRNAPYRARVLTLLNETANDAADVGPDEVDNVVAVGSVPAGPDVAYRALVVRLWPALLAL